MVECGALENKKWIQKDLIKSFTGTAQSYEEIGIEARHGKDIPPPKNPMTLTEAKTLIINLARDWLRSKL